MSRPALGRAVTRAGPPWRARRATFLLLVLGLAALAVPAMPHGPARAPAPALAAPIGDAGPAALAGAWSTFHGSENRSGYTGVAGPERGNVLWDVAPPGATPYPIQAGLIVDAGSLYASNDIGTLFAFNTSDNGTLSWERGLGGTLTAPDLVQSEIVVASSYGTVHALWASNGTPRWTTPVDGGVPQGVAASRDLVFVGTSAGSVYGINATTGALSWRTPVGGPIAGAPALEGSTLVVTREDGGVVALTTSGGIVWTRSVGALVTTAPSVSDGRVFVVDGNGNVTALGLSNGSVAWRWSSRPLSPGDSFAATPAVGLGAVFVSSQLGVVTALSLENGSPLWRHTTPGYAGYPVLSSPALAPGGLYVASADLNVEDLDPTDGQLLWSTPVGFVPSYPAPALGPGVLYVGTDLGSVLALGSRQGALRYPVNGTVTDPNGTPLVGALVGTVGSSSRTNGSGGFTLLLGNGSYVVTASALGFLSSNLSVAVAGPVAGLAFVLAPVPVVLVSGRVVNAASGLSIANATVFVTGAGLTRSAVSGPDGSFEVAAPVGPDYLTVSPPRGYEGLQEHLAVPATGLTGLEVGVTPTGESPSPWVLVAALAVMGLALAVVGLWEAARRRALLGQPMRLFSPFAQYVAMRALLLPGQVVVILAILFLFGTILPAAFFQVDTCQISSWACFPGSWSDPVNPPLAFLGGFLAFVKALFTGAWGMTSYGNLVEPAAQFLAWWLPNSIQLALFALPISALVAYAVGLYVGAHQDRPADLGVRLASVVGLLTPTFLLALLFLGAFYDPFLARTGDVPYGILPSISWFNEHGGIPPWVGIADTTGPTTLPIVDGMLHGDWPFVEVVFLKTIWQALLIALVYVAIFLRFARHAVASAFRESHIVAARARGVPESTILWRHAGRRVVPLFLLVFGLTLPIYLGTQAVVEALAQDPGVGTLLLSQMTQVTRTGFGFHSVFPAQQAGSLYQVTIFGLVILVLAGNLFADILARYVDPRLLRARR